MWDVRMRWAVAYMFVVLGNGSPKLAHSMADLQAVLPAESLETFHAQKLKRKVKLQETVVQRASELGVLVVKLNEAGGEGNTESQKQKQKQWINSASYNTSTLNPVLYKYVSEYTQPSKSAIKEEDAHSLVQSLLDTPKYLPPSGVAEKINEKRRERHEKFIKDMEEELAMISLEMEPRIKDASSLMQSQLTDNDQVIESLFLELSPEEILRDLKMDDLRRLWDRVAMQSPIREKIIQELKHTLQTVEEKRGQKIEEILNDYCGLLKQVSYLLPEDVERLIEQEAVTANMEILANRTGYFKLYAHLMTVDTTRENNQRKRWETLVQDWKDLLYKIILSKFVYFMESEVIVNPQEIEKMKESLIIEQKEVGRKRKELMDQASNFKPPKINTAQVYEWREAVDKLFQDLDSAHSSFLLKLQQCLDSTHRLCEDEMESFRKCLVKSEAYDSYTAYKLMVKDFVPLIDQHSQKMREELQNIEKGLDTVVTTQKTQFSKLFQFIQGAALLWDNQRTAIKKLQRCFQEELENIRGKHDAQNQNLEANLDVVLDRLRQGPIHESLKQYLDEALKMLETIKAGYTTFKEAVVEKAQYFPSSLKNDLEAYDSALCKHLRVERLILKQQRPKTQEQATSKDSGSNKDPTSPSILKKSKRTKTTIVIPFPPVKESDNELVNKKSVTYVLKKKVREEKDEDDGKMKSKPAFMTQDEDSESGLMSAATENILLTRSAFTQVKQSLRITFLEHLEDWKRGCVTRAYETIEAKEEEAQTELDLRLHLHVPRPSRIAQDIFTIRSVELTVHSERMGRHARGVAESLQQVKNTVQSIGEELSKKTTVFLSDLAAMDLSAPSNSRQLTSLISEAEDHFEKHKADIHSTISQYKEANKDLFSQLTISNDQYKASLKSFRKGGNYCPEEVENFNRKIDKISTKIASTKSFLNKEITQLMVTHQQKASRALNSLRDCCERYLAEFHFSEGITQELVSIQIAIQSEVAASNSHAKKLFADINNIKTFFVEVTNSKELFPSSMLPTLLEITSSVAKRADYLHCCPSRYKGRLEGYEEEPHKKNSVKSQLEIDDGSKKSLSVVNVSKSILERTRNSVMEPEEEERSKKRSLPTKPKVRKISPDNPEEADELSGTSSPTHLQAKQTRLIRRKTYEKKEDFFIGMEGGDQSSFLQKIKTILKRKYNEFYDLAETQSSLEQCMSSVEERMEAYRSQVEEYRADCIEEFQGQLEVLTSAIQEFPRLVYREIYHTHQADEKKAWQLAKVQLEQELEGNHKARKSFESSLQPFLGRPDKEKELAELCSHQEERHKDSQNITSRLLEAARHQHKENAQNFLVELMKMVQSLLSLMDMVISPLDVNTGKTKLKLPSIDVLLRQHVSKTSPLLKETTPLTITHSDNKTSLVPTPAPVSIKKKRIKSKVTSGKCFQWPQPKTDSPDVCVAAMGTIMSRKTSHFHEELINARDEIFEEYMEAYKSGLEEIENHITGLQEEEKNWMKNWQLSVHNLKQLYI